MNALAPFLFAASAAVILLLGLLHLLYTFRGTKLHPRSPQLRAQLEEISPVITRQTTMWRAWIGFNASHSFGAILFGLVYGYLALFHNAFLVRSAFLLCVGFVLLAGYAFLASAIGSAFPFVASCWPCASMSVVSLLRMPKNPFEADAVNQKRRVAVGQLQR